eukprot:Hpha_TRINITY_DN24740_c0_g1::TRINITY_DN24740_c0_g1_i1::g.110232::m.110232
MRNLLSFSSLAKCDLLDHIRHKSTSRNRKGSRKVDADDTLDLDFMVDLLDPSLELRPDAHTAAARLRQVCEDRIKDVFLVLDKRHKWTPAPDFSLENLDDLSV